MIKLKFRNDFDKNVIVKYLLFFFQLLNSIEFIIPIGNNLQFANAVTTADIIGNDIFFEIVDPNELQYTYRIRPAKDFGVPFSQYNFLENVPLVPTVPENGCRMPDNFYEIEGNVALIRRGECTFKSKTVIAEQAGALAVIITDDVIDEDGYYIDMIDDFNSQAVYIPVGFLLGKSGYMIRHTLDKLDRKFALINLPVNLTFIPVHKINQPPWLEW